MPNRNGTGPEGKGPRTGRGLGPCGEGQANATRGQGFGRSMARGMGARRRAELGNNEQK